MELKDKLVVITGVSKGIGRALVDQYLESGSTVVGLGRTEPKISNENFRFITCDVRSSSDVDAAFDKIKSEYNIPVSIMINNAGLGYFGFIEDYTDAQIHQLYETNVYSIFYTSRNVVPIMKENEYGHIINIASTAGIDAYPQVSAYCGTKFAVRAISESMYKEMRDYKIKVTCVYPGSVKTDFFRNSEGIDPHDYMLMPEDVATMIRQATQTPDNFHQVGLEVRPLQPKGPRKK
ncbi:SDR family oxidoreductase [bacterium]|nr:SDR family oxidoreductase [bacterium]